MHPWSVSLTLIDGNSPPKDFTFEDDAVCVIGRSSDCDIQVPRDFAHGDVSRHHCEIQIEPPHIRVRDLGSRNGTYVNGQRLGDEDDRTFLEAGPRSAGDYHDLHDGDVIGLGVSTFLRVRIRALEPSHAVSSSWRTED